MSADRTSALGVISRLRREIEHDRAALQRRVQTAQDLLSHWPASPSAADCALAAVTLHGWYTGLESLLERVVRQLDAEVPRGEEWHRDLLFQATAEIPGVRPAVIAPELTDELLQLLAFRHFFRHAYSVDLDPGHLHGHLGRLVACASKVDGDIGHLDDFLAQTTSSLTPVAPED